MISRCCPHLPLLLVACVPLGVVVAAPGAGDLAFFETKIRPVLVEKCLSCHSVEAQAKGELKGGLLLDSRSGVLQGGDTGEAIVVGRPERSLLIKALRHEVKDIAMPPKGPKLSAEVIADFERWIKDGAIDPREGAAPVTKKRGMSLEEGRKLWSMIPPKAVEGDIDSLVGATRSEQQLTANGEATAGALVRRLYLDLIGLPPTPEEVAAFEIAEMDAVVDRLLASRHFGERWGRHWLDAARFAESNGRDRNVMFYHAWRYRDYVIASFNADKPYDVFVQEQIAGDLMPAEDQARRDERLTATGFLALGAKAYEESKPEVFRMDVIDEQIETISRGVLGLSVACARCHDHKFDPIPAADYYALAGILRSTQPLYGYGPLGIAATAFHHTEWHVLGADGLKLAPAALDYARKLDAETLAKHKAASARYGVQRRLASAKVKLPTVTGAEKAGTEAEIKTLEADFAEWDVKYQALIKSVDAMQLAAPPQPAFAMGARDREQPEDCRIHIRGETTNLGDSVPRGFLQVVALPHAPAPSAKQSGRLELAQWLTRRDHPLTARVLVNRVWQHLMGRALVTTVDDFGVNGSKPSHPELLDHLAVRFMEQGWSVKRLIRDIVLSRTYRMSSDASAANLQRDPDNVFLWRMSPRATDVEVLRDSILSLSGQLNPYPPEQPFLARFHPQKDDELFPFKPFFSTAAIVSDHRSVYLPIVRGTLPEMFTLFDFAATERPVAQRNESLVPAQSLFLMNNPWVIEQARHTAARVLADSKLTTDESRLRRLYALAYGRAPEAGELQRALAFLQQPEELIPDPKAKTPPSAEARREARWTSLCHTIIASAEFRVMR